MSQSPDALREDFDRIARLSEATCRHADSYHAWLLGRVPRPCANALDVGCGTGAFSRALASVADRVLAIDLSPEMIRIAKDRSTRHPNVEYRVADFMRLDLPEGGFDCIASLATFHHLALKPALERLRTLLAPGGALLVLDVIRVAGAVDLLASALAWPVSVAHRWAGTGSLRMPRELAQAWDEHGRHDEYLTVREARRIYREILPGARVRRHLLWRYSVVWRKPVRRRRA